ncbi:protein kinase [Sphingobacteriaceae bacterium]|nr:protein kinase [Sphingobacteriaceae bacterium]
MQTLNQLVSGELKGIKELKLSCNLIEFPKEIFSLSDTLEVLDLSQNKLSELPSDFGRLQKLKIVFFSDNLFTQLPEVLFDCRELSMIGFKSNLIEDVPENALPPSTRWLILTNNKIKKLPASIGKCLPLQKVALAGNQLKSLPDEMANCKNLELLRISANQFTELPGFLLQLPRLSWLAFSGNPFSHTPEGIQKLNAIDWNEFEVVDKLGEGASGDIYKAVWKTQASNKEVAIKVFKGEVTSDGFPEDELEATVAAGIHPNLVTLLGELKSHPDKKQGLVMDLIPPSFYNLGLPPSRDTCSRDTFKPGTVFSVETILKIVTAIASTTSHLHARGILHGDLYAHNTLIDKDVNTLMGDFGAASFFQKEDKNADALRMIESRALGCLLDDLLHHCTDKDSFILETLKVLRSDLMNEDLHLRISVAQAVERLSTVM